MVLLTAPGTSAQARIAFTGRVVSASGQAMEKVAVTVYRQTTPTQAVTSASGDYRVELPSGSFIDYIVFEHADAIPKVVAGPFSGSAGSTLNIVMQSATAKVMSLPATLGAIQTIQFLKRGESSFPNLRTDLFNLFLTCFILEGMTRHHFEVSI